ncbi:hypothetical protein M404DRAFT_414260 [Pisolithus tinctorius Marx 270]|uniref:Cyanovirin-N domain-containing protein n=1 Tax=Pisolithus tinctorius Marx 270 TaxID=870435 RepID=A0A0C3J8S0_PISTI|nr:hypothetical protein M404DRAFT_414260 [Pisolithus tinctorius Marx 270]
MPEQNMHVCHGGDYTIKDCERLEIYDARALKVSNCSIGLCDNVERFEGIGELCEDTEKPKDLAGPSAPQSGWIGDLHACQTLPRRC